MPKKVFILQDRRRRQVNERFKFFVHIIYTVARTSLFKHMFSEHNFNIGLPDNLVYVTEFLDTLEAKLSK